jgi:arylsulfatase A-like enzyme
MERAGGAAGLWMALADAGRIMLAFSFFLSAAFLVGTGWKHFVRNTFLAASRDVGWMAPLSALLSVFLVLGGPVLVVALFRRSLTRGAAVFLSASLVAFAILLPWTQVSRLAAIVLAAGVGSAALKFFTTDQRLRVLYRTGMVLLGIQLAVAVAIAFVFARDARHGYSRLATAEAGAPNVLVILLDTVRGNGMSLYGYPRATTPEIDRFAAGGMVFDAAISTAPWTLPAHASLFTGRYAGELGTGFTSRLDGRFPTLAERFMGAGYETVGFTGNLHYTAWESGLSRGFLRWFDFTRSFEQVLRSGWIGESAVVLELLSATKRWQIREALRPSKFMVHPKPGGDERNADELTDTFLQWNAKRDPGRPFFAFINYFDAHDDYRPPEELRTRFAEDPKPRDLYDAELFRVDRSIGRLLAALEREGVLPRTVVAITADHGEHFGEHGHDGHGNTLYMENIKVPLVFRFDGRVPGGRSVHPVSIRDLGATLLDLAGVDAPFPGQSLVARWAGVPDSLAGSAAISELSTDTMPTSADLSLRSQQVSLVDRGHHLILRNRRNKAELYTNPSDGDSLPDLIGTPDGARTADRMRDSLRRALVPEGAPARRARSGSAPTL